MRQSLRMTMAGMAALMMHNRAQEIGSIGKIKLPLYRDPSGLVLRNVPRHTPKMSDRPARGWRVAIRQTKYRKLQARRRANGRAGR